METSIEEILSKNVYHWFKSLDINKQQAIAYHYVEDTGYNDNIVQGQTEHSTYWVVTNYTDELKDWIIIKLDFEADKGSW